MRLWTLHPRYLDTQGLLGVWREALMAQAVVAGRTKGYQQHPQLRRFRESHDPKAAIGKYLEAIWEEAQRRDYRFDQSKIDRVARSLKIVETDGQLRYEWEHLKRKLEGRSLERFQSLLSIDQPLAHPLFEIVPGKIRDWEKVR